MFISFSGRVSSIMWSENVCVCPSSSTWPSSEDWSGPSCLAGSTIWRTLASDINHRWEKSVCVCERLWDKMPNKSCVWGLILFSGRWTPSAAAPCLSSVLLWNVCLGREEDLAVCVWPKDGRLLRYEGLSEIQRVSPGQIWEEEMVRRFCLFAYLYTSLCLYLCTHDIFILKVTSLLSTIRLSAAC